MILVLALMALRLTLMARLEGLVHLYVVPLGRVPTIYEDIRSLLMALAIHVEVRL